MIGGLISNILVLPLKNFMVQCLILPPESAMCCIACQCGFCSVKSYKIGFYFDAGCKSLNAEINAVDIDRHWVYRAIRASGRTTPF